MKDFLLRLCIFLLPVAFLFVLPLYVYMEARENLSLQRVIESQRGPGDVLFGLAYRNMDRPYKAALVETRRSEVVALGTSRVMEFRASFFKDPALFTNAGGAVGSLPDMKDFISHLDTGKVRVLILGLDQKFFKEAPAPSLENGSDPTRAFLASAWRKIYLDLMQKKFSLFDLQKEHGRVSHIGLSALIKRDGFLNDGSYYYGATVQDPKRAQKLSESVDAVLARMREDRGSFYYGTIRKESFDELSEVLEVARAKGIYVVGVVPPYAPRLYEEVVRVDDEYSRGLRDVSSSIEKVFATYDFPLFDYTNARAAGITDTEFIDPGHASDKAYLRIVIDAAKRSPEVASYVSLAQLTTLLQETTDDVVFEMKD